MAFDIIEYRKQWYQNNKESHKQNTATRKAKRKATKEGIAEYALYASKNQAKRRGQTACTASIEELVEAMTGECKICGESEANCSKRLALDHDHVTGKFRGWLCGPCNRAIGMFKDNSELLEKAAAYLTSHNFVV